MTAAALMMSAAAVIGPVALGGPASASPQSRAPAAVGARGPAAAAAAGAQERAAAAPLAIGTGLRHRLLTMYAAYRHIPVSGIAPVMPGRAVAARTRSGQEWAMIHFQVARGAPSELLAAFQDGAGTGIFTAAPGHTWTVAGLAGEPMGCGVNLPAQVRQAWHLPGCQFAPRPPIAPGIAPDGTTADLVSIAEDQIGVGDDPGSTDFNVDCNPYTTLVDQPGLGGCRGARESHGSWFQNVLTSNEEWCSDFTKWVWEKAGVTSDLGTLTPYSGSFLTWGTAHREGLPADPAPSKGSVGDAVVIQVPGADPPDQHVGIVAAVNSNGTVNLVDGDFVGPGNITVQYNTDVSLPSFAASYGAGGEWFLVSPQLESAPPPSAGLPGGPAVYDPLDNALEVYGTGSDGNVEENWWKAGDWQASELQAGASPVSGRPSAVYDPVASHLEVYATGADGRIQEWWWSPGKWQTGELPATPSPVTGSPSAVYDPLNSALEVYAVGKDGQIQEDWWKDSKWETGELPATPSQVTGSPSAVYDPLNSALEVYAAGQDGQIEENWWKAKEWHAGEMPATRSQVTGSPSAVYDPVAGHLEVYAAGQDGLVEEVWWSPGNNWQTGELLVTSSPVTGSPSAVYDPLNSALEVYAPGQDGQIQEDWWKAKEWHTGQMPVTPSPVTGWPSAVYDPSATHLEVYAPGTDGQWQENWWSKANNWQAGELLPTPSPITPSN
jgi:Fungal fucose-specific lectin